MSSSSHDRRRDRAASPAPNARPQLSRLRAFILAATLPLAAVATAAADGRYLPVSIVEHERLLLRGVSAEIGQSGIQVRGWVRRDISSYGPISAHLHVEALAANGETQRTVEAGWQGELPSLVRYRRAAIFRVSLPSEDAIASVRVSIANGPRHPAST